MKEVDLNMAKSSIEKALEKQQKEAKRLADKQIRENKRQMEKDAIIQRAISVVNGQTFVGGMRIMDRNAEEILSIILSEYDGNENRLVHGHLDKIPEAYHYSISFEFEKLKMYGMISNSNMYLDETWNLNLTAQGITYFEDKKKAEEKEKSMKPSISIGSITATGSNFILGDVINSALSVDNSMTRIENEIEEKGGEEKQELKEILEEVKELIENIQESRHVPKNKGLFARLTSHLEKHSWFYAEVIGLLGGAALQMLQG